MGHPDVVNLGFSLILQIRTVKISRYKTVTVSNRAYRIPEQCEVSQFDYLPKRLFKDNCLIVLR
jgi:hypothetical protein